MSHRMYLYNVNTTENRKSHESNEGHPLISLLPVVGGNDIDSLAMMEWKYEFPLFLHPLFAGGPYLAPPLYNGTTGGIYMQMQKLVKWRWKRFILLSIAIPINSPTILKLSGMQKKSYLTS